jgi:hypothetical protein
MDKLKNLTANNRPVVYTSFDGDNMPFMWDMCEYVLKQNRIPVNPEAALGYYVSTVSLGGVKENVMADCLTLELLADEMWIFDNPKKTLAEGVIAEIILFNEIKGKGVKFVDGIDTKKTKETVLNPEQTKKWISMQDETLVADLRTKMLNRYNKNKSAYLIFNSKNFKHADWARAYCYKNLLCPLSPQNILPSHLYRTAGAENKYLSDRLAIMRRADKILLFADKFHFEREIGNLDNISQAELGFSKKLDKQVQVIGWDEAKVPKYDPLKPWALTNKENREIGVNWERIANK